MRASQTVCALVLLLSALPMFLGHPMILDRDEQGSECEGCGKDCNKCKYGSVYSDWCERHVCLKGPGEVCDRHQKHSLCGEGMYCRCNKCSGCSIVNLECFSVFCPYDERGVSLLRHSDFKQAAQLEN